MKRRSAATSLLLITHDLAVASVVTSRILVFYAGENREEGPSTQILSCPRHPYTQMLLRSIPRLDRPKKEVLETNPWFASKSPLFISWMRICRAMPICDAHLQRAAAFHRVGSLLETSTMIEARNLTKLYKLGAAVKNVSFILEQGEILGLVGGKRLGKNRRLAGCCSG